jgi:hypothetical protein
MPIRKKIPYALQKPLSEIFNLYAKEAAKDFPQLKGRFAILDVAAHDYHGDVDVKKSGFASDTEFADYLSKVCQSSEGGNTSKAKRRLKHGFCLIAFKGFMPVIHCAEQDLMRTLDHELGHLVVPDALGGAKTQSHTNFKECAADIFSCLKHIQRFGAGSNLIDKLAWKRAINLVSYGEIDHFTSFALDALRPLLDKIDVKALTPQQMTDLSWNIAAKFSLPENLIQQLDAAFKTVKSKVTKGAAVEERLKPVADFLCGDVDDHVFRAGLAYLKPYLETGTGFKGKSVDLSGDYWDMVRKTLAEKEPKLVKNNAIKFPDKKP